MSRSLKLSMERLCVGVITKHNQSCILILGILSTILDNIADSLLLLLVRLHDQSSSSDEVGGLLQVLQAPI